MPNGTVRIGIVAPSSPFAVDTAEAVSALAGRLFPDEACQLRFHPQCFRSAGHFAGPDEERAAALVEMANDDGIDAIWFARGGYGGFRLLDLAVHRLNGAARRKTYLGYSDIGSILGALYRQGFVRLAHGPMPSDIRRLGGEEAVARSLAFLVRGEGEVLEPSLEPGTPAVAFNLTILCHLLGTPWEPDLSGHVLMLEEVSEPMYRIDRCFAHLVSVPGMRRVAGIRLGRCSDIWPNDPDFGQTALEVARHWCERSGIPFLGEADIGHDVGNKIVPFGTWRPSPRKTP